MSARPANTGRVPPHNIEAEESLLGAMLLSRDSIAQATRLVRPIDFYKPTHAELFETIVGMYDTGTPVDVTAVGEELRQRSRLEAIGGTKQLARLMADTPASMNAQHYARVVAETGTRRHLIAAIGDAAEAVYDESLELNECIDRIDEMFATIAIPGDTPRESQPVSDFVTGEREYHWLVPRLIERRERVVFVAPEGYGKSTMLRQLAMQLSQGVHPFVAEAFAPLSVLLCDFENPTTMLRRSLRSLMLTAQQVARSDYEPSRLNVISRERGIDVTGANDKRWLFDQISYVRPDIICIGPLYKLHVETLDEEQAARRVADVLDQIRTTFDCALLIEAHAPHGQTGHRRAMRPAGSSLWLRWPDYGFGLVADKKYPNRTRLDRWKGERELREWPHALRRGGRWPWSVEYSEVIDEESGGETSDP